MNAKTKAIMNISVLTFLLVAASSQCFAEMTIEQVSKKRAKELGMEIQTKASGSNALWVELEFKPEGKFKDFSHVSLEIREGEKLLVGYAALREKRSRSGSVVVTFVANRAFLDKITLRVVVADVPLGGSGYELRVKDFVELVKPSPNAPPPGAVTNLVPLKLGSSIPLAVQLPGVAWKGNLFNWCALTRSGLIWPRTTFSTLTFKPD